MSAEFQPWWQNANLPGDPYEQQQWRRTVEAAFELGRSCATPAPGAPAEPTEAMVLAMVRRMFSERNYAAPWEDVMRLAYMDAIAAAPGAPGQEAAAVQAVAQETDRDWSKAQDWKGMDGATAFLLINRHSDGWGDVGAMMNAWLAANAATPAAVQAVGAEREWLKCDACGKDMRGHDRMGHCGAGAGEKTS